jgi:peroxiredoxin Q/BCP
LSLAGILRYAFQQFRGAPMLAPGDAAPDFEATDHEGNRVRLRDFRGSKVVLWFYPKAGTGG